MTISTFAYDVQLTSKVEILMCDNAGNIYGEFLYDSINDAPRLIKGQTVKSIHPLTDDYGERLVIVIEPTITGRKHINEYFGRTNYRY